MNKRMTEGQRKSLIVLMELNLCRGKKGKSAQEIADATGIGYYAVWEYIRRYRNAGKVESMVQPNLGGQLHRRVN